ncbi:hypothetical protein PMAYCL1PPCAC_14424, partial [Pristionchus mayeri]
DEEAETDAPEAVVDATEADADGQEEPQADADGDEADADGKDANADGQEADADGKEIDADGQEEPQADVHGQEADADGMETDADGQEEPQADADEQEAGADADAEDADAMQPEAEADAAAIEADAVIDEGAEMKLDESMEEFEEDDDIYILDEAEDGPVINDEMRAIWKERQELADKFFDPESPTNVANLAPETRQQMAKYAAAIFEWFCCMPSPDMLGIVPPFADIAVPFPVPPGVKRALVRRDLGQRLTDVWRQTKDPEKLANHFKVPVNIAILSLIDYAFANPSYELDIIPLIKMQYIDKTDYCRDSAFILENCDPRFWKEPEELITESLDTPICTSIVLYLMTAECMRGTSLSIPWKDFERNIDDVPPEMLAGFEETLKEALKELAKDSPVKQQEKELNEMMATFEKESHELRKMESKMREQIQTDMRVLKDLEAKYMNVKDERRAQIASIKPANFDEHGAKLAQAEDEIIVTETRHKAEFASRYLLKTDVAVEAGARVLARRKEDASEKFEEATFVEMEALDPDADHALVKFASDPDASVSLPLTSIAINAPIKPKMPVMAEGIRVVARVRHPLRARDPPAFYSGTVFSKFDIQTEEYAVAFDDFFDEYINVRDMHLMLAQSFVDRPGQVARMDKRWTYLLVTPNNSIACQSTERMVFMLFFLAKYPDWALVRFPDKPGTNVATAHRDGRSWSARTLAVDRQMVWLRFDPFQDLDSSDELCLAFPCKDATHTHHDEKMYRGCPRIKQQRINSLFERTMNIYRALVDTVQPKELHQMVFAKLAEREISRHEVRRAQRLNHGGMFEPAVPAESDRSERVKMSQTARKRGTGLMEIEPAARSKNRTSKRELRKTIKYHEVEKIDYSLLPLHSPCTHECLGGNDADASDERFKEHNISPYFIPVLCGWRRIKQSFTNVFLTHLQPTPIEGIIMYRAPCGRPLFHMDAVTEYLRETRSELTVDLFNFSYKIDETAYVHVDMNTLVMDDISQGAEGRPIPVANDVDTESPPSFIYRQRRYPLNKKMADTMAMTMTNNFCSGCDCTDDCSDWTKCACQRLTHSESVRTRHALNNVTKGYTNRLLKERVGSGLYECNENCGCSRKRCINRVVQNELKIPMQMVKTYGMGWGVRTLVDIPHGTFISCYHGAVLSDNIGENYGEGDEYYADIDFYDLVETEKNNAGSDAMADQGVFFEDVGLRDLTPAEIRAVQKEDEIRCIQRHEAAAQRRARQKDVAAARRARRNERERKKEEKRKEEQKRMSGGGDAKELVKTSEEAVKDEEKKEVKE